MQTIFSKISQSSRTKLRVAICLALWHSKGRSTILNISRTLLEKLSSALSKGFEVKLLPEIKELSQLSGKEMSYIVEHLIFRFEMLEVAISMDELHRSASPAHTSQFISQIKSKSASASAEPRILHSSVDSVHKCVYKSMISNPPILGKHETVIVFSRKSLLFEPLYPPCVYRSSSYKLANQFTDSVISTRNGKIFTMSSKSEKLHERYIKERDDLLESQVCPNCGASTDISAWIYCDSCHAWIHQMCEGIAASSTFASSALISGIGSKEIVKQQKEAEEFLKSGYLGEGVEYYCNVCRAERGLPHLGVIERCLLLPENNSILHLQQQKEEQTRIMFDHLHGDEEETRKLMGESVGEEDIEGSEVKKDGEEEKIVKDEEKDEEISPKKTEIEPFDYEEETRKLMGESVGEEDIEGSEVKKDGEEEKIVKDEEKDEEISPKKTEIEPFDCINEIGPVHIDDVREISALPSVANEHTESNPAENDDKCDLKASSPGHLDEMSGKRGPGEQSALKSPEKRATGL
ncbi:hypothetical protein ADUPG1_010779 [Aduncisulcus paluster]|uniref:Zinc finger PHD-type domain-containing protein n=1 Tax=Aduncisulcus paluster TaxID=2918883 RepID=A0ABQ5JST2_9EUKA|nr:hypothetical protein ADUPG1_010779 [Aduncisulcus paluster]